MQIACHYSTTFQTFHQLRPQSPADSFWPFLVHLAFRLSAGVAVRRGLEAENAHAVRCGGFRMSFRPRASSEGDGFPSFEFANAGALAKPRRVNLFRLRRF